MITVKDLSERLFPLLQDKTLVVRPDGIIKAILSHPLNEIDIINTFT